MERHDESSDSQSSDNRRCRWQRRQQQSVVLLPALHTACSLKRSKAWKERRDVSGQAKRNVTWVTMSWGRRGRRHHRQQVLLSNRHELPACCSHLAPAANLHLTSLRQNRGHPNLGAQLCLAHRPCTTGH